MMEAFICILYLLMTDAFWRCIGHEHFLNPQQGKSFLSRSKRDVIDCSIDRVCEYNMIYCRENWEVGREQFCVTAPPCPGTKMCYLSQPCYHPAHPIKFGCRNCRPGPADIVFVVDTSASVRTENNKSIEFIDEFIRKVPIGPDDFQIGVITFNFVPEVLFNLNDHTSESDMLLDLLTIKTQEAATFTAPALQKAAEMLNSNLMGGRSGVAKYIILLYDGLASDENDAVTTAASIIAMNIRILTVGFGNSISHKEMMMLSQRRNDTFNLPHLNHLINRMFKETADTDCNDCSLQTGTDLLILLDISKKQTKDGYNDRLITTRKIIESVLSYNPTARIGMMSYSEEPEQVFSLSWSNDRDKLIAAALQVKKESLNFEANTSHALEHIRKNNSFSSKRKIILLLSDGNWNDKDKIKHEIELLDQEGVEVTGALAGDDCVIDNYSDIIKDPSLLYYVEFEESDWTALESLASTTTYYECIDDIFIKRQ